MEEQLISFETAKACKNKILLKSSFHYRIGKEIYFTLDMNSSGYPIVSQSVLQKILREQHKLIVLVDRLLDSYICKINNQFIYPTIKIKNSYYVKKYNSYEEALEDGLQKALTMIK